MDTFQRVQIKSNRKLPNSVSLKSEINVDFAYRFHAGVLIFCTFIVNFFVNALREKTYVSKLVKDWKT